MQHWTVGEVRIHAVLQAVIPIPPSRMFADAPALLRAAPDYCDSSGNILMAIQSYLIESGQARVLVDTCFGDSFLRTRQIPDRFAESLAATGFRPEDITTVVCTHLHRDHAGGNTVQRAGQWVPAYPNADYLVTAAEHEHWGEFTGEDRVAPECVAPLKQCGRLRLTEADHRVADGIRLVPTAGHTPGHVSVRIESGGSARLDGGEAKLGPPHERGGSARLDGGEAKLGPPHEPAGAVAYISGDVVHHPAQIGDPGICALPDADPGAARASRLELLRRVADERALLLGSHFAAPSGGYVHSADGGMVWQPLVEREGAR
ncbi:MBL fold metallo-hydrolase [Mycolicibacter senuensis]|uniref:MBL fold metallo-hydrolase n=1 Tax=Mycolicibacter senuensis TaxID=386913 RepID=A0A7I9XFR0_9MYCO|nr:MBL fold metallo-hydrolase [Mycolicibacter senuensis]ORW65258.1 MBL fold metallo-hydrolase [Mycolicibacter senuensis]GFG68782.1 MBL fold metallo-hydrolase [Mycolicibacter senuensis]